VATIKKLLSAVGLPDSCVDDYATSLVDKGVGTKATFNRLSEGTMQTFMKKGHIRAISKFIGDEASAKSADKESSAQIAAVKKLLSAAGVPDSCVDEYADTLAENGISTKTVLTKVVKKKLLVRCAVVVFTGFEEDAAKTMKKCRIKTGHMRLISESIASHNSLDLLDSVSTKRKAAKQRKPAKRRRGSTSEEDTNGSSDGDGDGGSSDGDGGTGTRDSSIVYLEYRSGSSDKFWSIRVDGNDSITLFGRRGSHGTKALKTHASDAEAVDYAADLTHAKRRKGYVTATAPATLASGWADVEAAATLKARHAKADATSDSPYLECTTGSSNKFWRIHVTDVSTVSTYGRIGTAGVSAVKEHGDEAQADEFAAQQIHAKLKKGYVFAEPPDASGASDDDDDDGSD
jgi:predicted DNA-binding WGR domain protein